VNGKANLWPNGANFMVRVLTQRSHPFPLFFLPAKSNFSAGNPFQSVMLFADTNFPLGFNFLPQDVPPSVAFSALIATPQSLKSGAGVEKKSPFFPSPVCQASHGRKIDIWPPK